MMYYKFGVRAYVHVAHGTGFIVERNFRVLCDAERRDKKGGKKTVTRGGSRFSRFFF